MSLRKKGQFRPFFNLSAIRAQLIRGPALAMNDDRVALSFALISNYIFDKDFLSNAVDLINLEPSLKYLKNHEILNNAFS